MGSSSGSVFSRGKGSSTSSQFRNSSRSTSSKSSTTSHIFDSIQLEDRCDELVAMAKEKGTLLSQAYAIEALEKNIDKMDHEIAELQARKEMYVKAYRELSSNIAAKFSETKNNNVKEF